MYHIITFYEMSHYNFPEYTWTFIHEHREENHSCHGFREKRSQTTFVSWYQDIIKWLSGFRMKDCRHVIILYHFSMEMTCYLIWCMKLWNAEEKCEKISLCWFKIPENSCLKTLFNNVEDRFNFFFWTLMSVLYNDVQNGQ